MTNPPDTWLAAALAAATARGLAHLAPLERQRFLDGFDESIAIRLELHQESSNGDRALLRDLASIVRQTTSRLLDQDGVGP